MYSNFDKALKLQILVRVYDIFTRAIKSECVADRNLGCCEVINCPKNNYYRITPTELKDSGARMTSAYNSNQPLKMVIE